jgi:hypothetical protein
MKLLIITADLAAIGVVVGSALNWMPAIAGLLAAVYYGFVIYDRVKYGPEIGQRKSWTDLQRQMAQIRQKDLPTIKE